MSKRVQVLMGLAALVVVLGGLRAAKDLMTPVLAGLMVAAISSPLVISMLRRRVPPLMGALLVLVLDVGVLGLFGVLLALAASDLQEQLPLYLQKLTALADRLGRYMGHDGVSVLKGDQLGDLLGGVAAQFAALASHLLVMLLVVFFTNWELALLLRKLRSLSDNAPAQYARVNRLVQQVQRYLVVKTWTSFLIAVAAFLSLKLLGVGSALLLALSLFLLHFIPNVGAFLAAAPALLVAWAERGWGTAALVALIYLVLNTLIGGILEPKMLGNRLGMSPLLVLLSMLFWGWLWGPMGALLSVPLLVVVRILLETSEDFAWLTPWLEAEPNLPSLPQSISLSRFANSLRWRTPPEVSLEPAPPTQPAHHEPRA